MDREEKIAKLVKVGDRYVRAVLQADELKRGRLEKELWVLRTRKGIHEEALARIDGSDAKEAAGARSEPRT